MKAADLKHSELTVKGALLVADSTIDDGSCIHRHAVKVLAQEVRRLQRKLARTVKSQDQPTGGEK